MSKKAKPAPVKPNSIPNDISFETVDNKVAETEFFLRKMCEAGFNPLEFNWYFSAFLSAARTSTLALQRFKHISEFEKWYLPHQDNLKSSELAKFYLETRNEHVHGGSYPVSAATIRGNNTVYFFAKKNIVPEDVVSISRKYFLMLLEIVYDCYECLGVHIDPQQYYTKEHFSSIGKTIDAAEAEIWGFIRISLIDEGYSVDDRWHELRSKVGECEINHLFYSYLARTTSEPVVPDHYHDFAFTPDEKGWNHIPAGFDSLEAYRKAYGLPEPEN